jgi:7,8-dihydroneopterin aldolase/epimerase/oxygenase
MKFSPTSKIFVRNLVLDTSIGALSHELHGMQKVRFSVEMTVPTILDHNDKVNNIVPYHLIVEKIKTIVGEGHVELVETLSQRIARAALEDRRVIDVIVTVEKLEVIPLAEAAGIVTFASRD